MVSAVSTLRGTYVSGAGDWSNATLGGVGVLFLCVGVTEV